MHLSILARYTGCLFWVDGIGRMRSSGACSDADADRLTRRRTLCARCCRCLFSRRRPSASPLRSVGLSACLSVCLSVCLPACLSTFLTFDRRSSIFNLRSSMLNPRTSMFSIQSSIFLDDGDGLGSQKFYPRER